MVRGECGDPSQHQKLSREKRGQPGSECNNTDPESRVHLTKEKKDFLCGDTNSFFACEL